MSADYERYIFLLKEEQTSQQHFASRESIKHSHFQRIPVLEETFLVGLFLRRWSCSSVLYINSN
jgi:hypothetical protein